MPESMVYQNTTCRKWKTLKAATVLRFSVLKCSPGLPKSNEILADVKKLAAF
jgi:hypothetical protein